MSMLRIVTGKGEATCQDILQLAGRLADSARELGLRIEAIRASRTRGSASRYITLLDHRSQRWLIRVSNHRMSIGTNHPVPHLDFVSLDGAEGLHEATLFLHRVTMGLLRWRDLDDPALRAKLKERQKARRTCPSAS